MKPLIILLSTFLISLLIIKVTKKEYDFALSARIAMSIMLAFTAIGHFVYTKGMTLMIPSPIPLKQSIIYFTGIMEIVLAIGLLFPKYLLISGKLIILFFILLLPANIYAAINTVNYQTATYDGPGLMYLWFRIPLQILFIVWVWLSSVRLG